MWVLVRYAGIPDLFVLKKAEWETYNSAGRRARYVTSEAIAESDDYAELEGFRKLSCEEA